MTPLQVQLTSAFVLHTRPFRETSMLVDFFTKEFGRLSAIVRGVRKARSAHAGLLLPFLPLCVSFRGKTDLLNIQTLESSGKYYVLQNQVLFCGLYVNELLYRLLHRHDPYPVLYDLYQKMLEKFQDFQENQAQQQWVLYLFVKKLLQEIGYGLQWDKVAGGGAVMEDEYYYFEFGKGFGRDEEHSQRQNQSGKICGKSLLALHYGDYQNDSRDSQIERLYIGQEGYIPKAQELKEISSVFNTIFHHLLGDEFLLCQQIFGQTTK